jgi:F-type H+-transporting ATPase subunit alpha
MPITSTELTELLKKSIADAALSELPHTEGKILSVRDGVVSVYGLSSAAYGEKIRFENGTFGMALNLEKDSVGVIILGKQEGILEGQTVYSTGEMLSTPVGEALLGRVVNALGQPIDHDSPIHTTETLPIERIAPGVIAREPVNQPLQTGLKIVDALVPVGRGQRELIIGDRQTGKTTIAVDAIINQKGTGVKCIYVAIGQKASSVASVVAKLKEAGALDHTIIVAANASDAAALQFIAPYVGCSMGEYFRDKGMDALIIYDDLTKQAWAYRQISLLLRRPPGREAYPGDVFYVHSRLLERAARVNTEYVEKITHGKVTGKTGSLTALPIIETQAGDISAFVPTNVISITDGQIFMETNLFNAGIRPALNAGLSVSRVGGAAQTGIIKKLGGGELRLALAQYRELEAFAQFSQDLDPTTRAQLAHGQQAVEILKQGVHMPMSVAEMSVSLFAVARKYLSAIPLAKIGAFEKGLLSLAHREYAQLLESINKNPKLTPEHEAGLDKLLKAFCAGFVA